MHEYLRLWKLVPRLMMGTLFFGSLVAIFVGPRLQPAIGYVETLDLKILGAFVSGLAIIFTFVGLSSIGIYLLQITAAFIGGTLRVIVRITRANFILEKFGFSLFVMSPAAFAVKYFREDAATFREFLFLRNTAVPEGTGRAKEIRNHTDKTVAHLLSLQKFEILYYLAFMSSFSQDQRKLTNAKEDINEIYYLWLTLVTMTVAIIRFNYTRWAWLWVVLVSVTASVILYPLLRERIKNLGFYLLYAYLDNLTVGSFSPMQEQATE